MVDRDGAPKSVRITGLAIHGDYDWRSCLHTTMNTCSGITFGQAITLGLMSGLLAFIVLTCIRNWLRNDLIRAVRSEEYLIGWKDGVNHVKTQIDRWVKHEPERRE